MPKRSDIKKILVEDNYSGIGIGSEMLQSFCGNAAAKGYDVMLSFAAESMDTEFFQFMMVQDGFSIKQEEGYEVYLSKEDAKKAYAMFCSRFPAKKADAEPFFEKSSTARSKFLEVLEKSHPAIAWEIQNQREKFHKSACFCHTADTVIESVCLVKEQEDALELSFLYALPEKGQAAAKALLGTVYALQKEKIKPVRIMAINDASLKLLQHLNGAYQITKRLYTAYYFA